MTELKEALWPATRLGDAVTELLRRAGLAKTVEIANPQITEDWDSASWLDWAAGSAECEAEPIHTSFGALDEHLSSCFPALIEFEDRAFAVVAAVHNGRAKLIDPAGRTRSIPVSALSQEIRKPLEQEQSAQFIEILRRANIPARRQAKALRAMLNEHYGKIRFDRCWIVRRTPGEPLREMLGATGAVRNGLVLIAAHTIEYLLWLAAWGLLGKLSLEGRLDRGWILAWVLLLASLVPCHIIGTWSQGLFSIGLGGSLKRRLLYGALRLSPEEMRHAGMGSFLGQAIEAEAVETLALSGGVAGALAVIEIVLAAAVLGKYALLLALWVALAGFVAWRFLRSYENWTTYRMRLTQDLVESMVGHRTRLAQLRREHWHEQEDLDLRAYLGFSRQVDGRGAPLIALLPRTWLLAGIAAIGPSIFAGKPAAAQTAVALGGVLLAYMAFRRLTGSFADIAAAIVACKRIAPLYRAASRKEAQGDWRARRAKSAQGEKLLEADRLTFRYRSSGSPALQPVSMAIRSGEKILLEGASGGGKSTFASLLSGLRQPESGLLLLNGLDRHSTGERQWRKQVVSVPQFHENHILTETLAFNLLMGRGWPPTATDMGEAEEVCRELGLGPLLDRMPSGLLQMTGEGGWQLSHGEQSRVFVARALLQDAEMVILDESFAALDPENLQLAMDCALKRSQTLMVIAHP